MTDLTMPSPPRWGAVPDWAWHVIEDPKVYRFYGWMHSKIDSSTRSFWRKQIKIAEEYGVSVSTISRWMNYLKRVGAVSTRYRWAADTDRRLSDLITLPIADPRSPACMSTVDVHTTEVSTPTTSLTSFERVPSGSLRSPDERELEKLNGSEVPMKISPDQISLFADETGTDPFDSVRSSCHTGTSKIRKKVVTEECGSPTYRVMGYWLKGRNKRPKPGVVAGVGRAVRTCLDSGVDEKEIERAFDALMSVGLDAYPNQLLARFGLRKRPKNYKPRDYEKRPLWQHQPRASTMTSERKIATTPPQYRPGWTTPSFVATSTLSSAPLPTSGPPSTTTGTPEPITVRREVKAPSKERYSYDYEEYDAGTMVRRQRSGRSISDVMKSIGFGRGN